MQRLHLFEWEDFPWLPRAIRNGGTDLLDLAFDRMGLYAPLAPVLLQTLQESEHTQLVDVCSGGGGGALSMLGLLRRQGHNTVRLTLSDRFPNPGAMARVEALKDPLVTYSPVPVDALEGRGTAQPGVRTMFGALHHFQPAQVQALIQAAVDAKVPLAFFDVAASPAIRQAPLVALPVLAAVNMVMLGLASLALLPLVRPVKPASLLLTYVLPLIPLLVAWDGTVSALRAYTPDELDAFARQVTGADAYQWKAGVTSGNGPAKAVYLVGVPKR